MDLAGKLEAEGRRLLNEVQQECQEETVSLADTTGDTEKQRLMQLGKEEEERLRTFYVSKGEDIEKEVIKELEDRGRTLEVKVKAEFEKRGEEARERIKREFELKGEVQKNAVEL